jgi:(p)ppGpp synthase/HD superfamily hydrolase
MADSLRGIRAQPHDVWLVKLADRITKLQPTPSYWTVEKRKMYLADTKMILDVIDKAST